MDCVACEVFRFASWTVCKVVWCVFLVSVVRMALVCFVRMVCITCVVWALSVLAAWLVCVVRACLGCLDILVSFTWLPGM